MPYKDLDKRRQSSREAVARYNKRHPERVKETQRRTKLKLDYGLTLEEYDAMLIAQGGVCAICLRPETHKWRGNIRALSVDHDHRTGKIRALLCNTCNHALGAFEDDPAWFRTAADYIELHHNCVVA